MTILGAIVRTRPDQSADLRERLSARAGVDIALDPGDGRLILVIEDSVDAPAAAVLAEIASWPVVISTSLVYEYSGPDAPSTGPALESYTDWRDGLSKLLTTRPKRAS